MLTYANCITILEKHNLLTEAVAAGWFEEGSVIPLLELEEFIYANHLS
jgi:hypothetical protein